MFGVRSGNEGLEFEKFSLGQRTAAFPGKLRLPIDADTRNQCGRLIFSKVAYISIEGGVTQRFTDVLVQVSSSGNDDEDRGGVLHIILEGGENIRVIGQHAVQGRVKSPPVFFQVDQKCQFRTVRKNMPVIFPRARAERV